MEAPKCVLALPDLVDRWMVEGVLARWVCTMQTQPTGGCHACRFAEPLRDRLCTRPDIGVEDGDLGVSGLSCARFVPYAAPSTDSRR